MFDNLTCLQQHEPTLLAMAAVIGLLAASTALLLTRWALPPARAPLAWIAAAAAVASCGVWSTHFVAILAFDPGLPIGFEPWRTLLSGVIAFVCIGAGLYVAVVLRHQLLGGAVTGLGVGAMHFVGMTALQLQATVEWNPVLVALSLTVGVVFCAAALRIALRTGSTPPLFVGALLYTVGVGGLHMIAMLALQLSPSPLVPAPPIVISRALLSIAVIVTTVVILLAFLIGALIHHRLTEHIARQNSRLKAMADSAFEGLIIAVDGHVTESNQQLASMIGLSQSDLVGRSVPGLVAPHCRHLIVDHLEPQTCGPHDLELIHADGQYVPVEVRGRRIDVDGRIAVLYALRDLTKERQAKSRIEYLAHHDALTDLPNRVLCQDRLGFALANAARRNERVALIHVDLDHFKDINDVYGHAAGDLLLSAVARRLRTISRSSDTLARLGGNDFAVVCVNVADETRAAAIAQRILDVLAEPFDLNGSVTTIGCSIGIALSATGVNAATDLMRDASLALYRCKAQQRGTFVFFEEGMNVALQTRKSIEHDLREALVNQDFLLNYQPQVDLRSGRLIGVEALLRWQHPQRGLVPPAEFVPIAEDMGLIGSMGAWALHQACRDAARYWPGISVAVNLSPVQLLQPGLEDTIDQALAESGLPPERLEVEITERVLLRDTETTLRSLTTLRARGIAVAIDDFGTGYSSLSYLHRFPFDRIKIDRSFVSRLGTDDDARAIVRAIIGLGRSLGGQTIAEGIETEEQWQLLLDEGCEAGQGYLFGRPAPVEAITACVERGIPVLGEEQHSTRVIPIGAAHRHQRNLAVGRG